MKTYISDNSLLRRALGILLGLMVLVSMMPFGTMKTFAATQKEFTQGDYTYHLYDGTDDNTGVSVWITKYSGKAAEIVVPTTVTYNGKTYNNVFIGSDAFKGNTTIKKVAIPKGCDAIGGNAFSGCTSLVEVAIENDGVYLSTNAFSDCPNLKTYRINGAASESQVDNSGIGRDSSGNVYEGVTVYTKPGSNVEKAIGKNDGSESGTVNGKSKDEGNGKYINVNTSDSNPYSKNTVNPSTSSPSGGTPSTPAKEPSSPYEKGASEARVEKAITSSTNDKDPAGSTFYLLQAKAKKVAKTSVTIGWTKTAGAAKYVIYGNMCNVGNKKYKYVKLATVKKGTSKKFTKIKKTKVKKGTYYKFKVVAFDKNNKVIATSKTVHVATTGGKVGNDKAVKTAAKKDKVSIKKNKSFKLNATSTPASKKLKVQKHRAIAYESSNPSIATVSSKGVIKGKKAGTCYVYAYAQNGVFKKIKVTVK